MEKGLLKEVKQICEQSRVRNIEVPIPSYLFLKQYGRNIKNDMEEVTRILGEKEWFFFQTSGQTSEESLLFRFQRHQERTSGLGKVFQGCVLIEISGEEEGKEWYRFLEYLEEQKEQIRCFFTTDNLDAEKEIRECLERHFFVRVLKGEAFDQREQLEIFEKTLEEFDFSATKETLNAAQSFFEERRWTETEDVEKSIRNLAKTLVYEKMLNDEEGGNVIESGEWERVLKIKGLKVAKKHTFGFVMD